MRFKRHCLACNQEYPRWAGRGAGGGFCSEFCHALAWADFVNDARECHYRSCDCPGGRWHTRRACGKRTRGRLDGRCINCGHYADAHHCRPGSSFNYSAPNG